MKLWKRWSAALLMLALCMGLLAGCTQEEVRPGLSVCVGDEPETLDPIYATAEGDQTILVHLYENLMRVTVDVSGGTTVTGRHGQELLPGEQCRRYCYMDVPAAQCQVVRRQSGDGG